MDTPKPQSSVQCLAKNRAKNRAKDIAAKDTVDHLAEQNIVKSRCVALTGAIATGKSSVAKLLEEAGFKVIYADRLARDAVKPESQALREIQKAFGDEVIQKDGTLNRQQLSTIVFSSTKSRQTLEAILHPRIRSLFLQAANDIANETKDDIFFYEIPLLFEKSDGNMFLATIATVCSPEVQELRLCRRDSISEKKAAAIISSQMSAQEKAKLADFAVNTEASATDLREQILAISQQIKARLKV